MALLPIRHNGEYLPTWNAFWFTPGYLLDLAVVRIVAVFVQLTIGHSHLATHVPYSAQFSAAAYEPLYVIKLFMGPFDLDRPDVWALAVVWWITLIAGLMALIGWRTRLSLLVFAFGSTFLTAFIYSFGEVHHVEPPMLIALFLLAFAPVGGAMSLDKFLSLRKKGDAPTLKSISAWGIRDEMATWSIRSIQCIFALMYLSAVLSKLFDPNGYSPWANGLTLQYYMIMAWYKYGNELALWVSAQHYLILVGQWLVIFVQGTFWLALLIRPMLWVYVPLGFAFHFSILITLDAPFYHWMALYVIFIPWTAFFKYFQSRKQVPA